MGNLSGLSQGELVIIVLIVLVLVIQITLFSLLKKRIKTSLEKLENELKVSTRNEIDRLAGELIAPQYRSPEPGPKINTANKDEVIPFQEEENNGLSIDRTEGTEIGSYSPAYVLEMEQLEEEKRISTPTSEPEKNDYLQPQDNWIQQEVESTPTMAAEIEKPEHLPGDQPQVEQSHDPWVKDYNLAINSEANQNRFLDKYRPIRVDVINALERRRKANVDPIYQSAYNGDYYVIEVQEQGQTLYAVLPRFDLVIKESNYKAGAFGEVFEFINYDNDYLHRVIKVFASAFFAKKQHENWELLSRGKIQLDFEEP